MARAPRARRWRAGALGLSTGLEYDPGIYSSRAEVVELARVAARHGGRYISHVRSEDRALLGGDRRDPRRSAARRSSRCRSRTSSSRCGRSGARRRASSRGSIGRARRGSTSPPTSIRISTGTRRSPCSSPSATSRTSRRRELVLDRDRAGRRPAARPLRPRAVVRRQDGGRDRAARARRDAGRDADRADPTRRGAAGAAGASDVESVIGTSMIEPDLEAAAAPGRTPTSAPTASSTAATRAASAPIRACSAATCASGACSRSRRRCAG